MPFSAFILCATPRSGSTLLCDLLAGSGVTGRPNSFYREESIPHFARALNVPMTEGADCPAFDRDYLEAIRREGKGDGTLAGIRVMWPSVAEASRRLDRVFPGLSSDSARFARAFGEPRYLFLSRRDKVAQAISRLKAEQTGLWHRAADGSERERSFPPRPAVYDADRLDHFVGETRDHEAAWRRWFDANDITPLMLTYEALSENPNAVLAKVLTDLSQDPALASKAAVATSRLADAESLAWAAQYRADRRGIFDPAD